MGYLNCAMQQRDMTCVKLKGRPATVPTWCAAVGFAYEGVARGVAVCGRALPSASAAGVACPDALPGVRRGAEEGRGVFSVLFMAL